MYDIFGNSIVNVNDISNVTGLTYVPNFLSKEEEISLIESIMSEKWLTDIKRRVQHYGYKYDYKSRSIDYSMFIGPLPSWALLYANKLQQEKHIDKVPDQLIVNEYLPGQGIANHTDCEPCFDETIISISLGSNCIMDFINLKTKQKVQVLLKRRSLVILNGDARYKWSHGIPKRKTDEFNGRRFERGTRISMTFRKVIIDN